MASTDTLVNPQLQALLLCLQVALEDHPGFIQPPAVISIRAGERAVTGITLDGGDECRCGYAWVRAVSNFPTSEDDFPGPFTGTQPQCGMSWGIRMEMGIARCAPDPTQHISPAQWQELNLNLMLDWASLRQAICCYITPSPPWRYSIGEITPSGPEGLCLRSTVEVATMLEDCDGC